MTRAWQKKVLPFLAVPVTLFGVTGWFAGLYAASKSQHWLLFSIDFALPPVGAIHGWGFLLGFW
jgi:hypothetical protein